MPRLFPAPSFLSEHWKGHLRLAKWCRGHKLKAEARYHFERVLEQKPEHRVARRALGHQKVKGEWRVPRAQRAAKRRASSMHDFAR